VGIVLALYSRMAGPSRAGHPRIKGVKNAHCFSRPWRCVGRRADGPVDWESSLGADIRMGSRDSVCTVAGVPRRVIDFSVLHHLRLYTKRLPSPFLLFFHDAKSADLSDFH